MFYVINSEIQQGIYIFLFTKSYLFVIIDNSSGVYLFTLLVCF